MSAVTWVTLLSASLFLVVGIFSVEIHRKAGAGPSSRLVSLMIACSLIAMGGISYLAIHNSMTLGRGLFLLGTAAAIVLIWRRHRNSPSVG